MKINFLNILLEGNNNILLDRIIKYELDNISVDFDDKNIVIFNNLYDEYGLPVKFNKIDGLRYQLENDNYLKSIKDYLSNLYEISDDEIEFVINKINDKLIVKQIIYNLPKSIFYKYVYNEDNPYRLSDQMLWDGLMEYSIKDKDSFDNFLNDNYSFLKNELTSEERENIRLDVINNIENFDDDSHYL